MTTVKKKTIRRRAAFFVEYCGHRETTMIGLAEFYGIPEGVVYRAVVEVARDMDINCITIKAEADLDLCKQIAERWIEKQGL